jgi:hypothetical protein
MQCNCPDDCCRELARLREENIALRVSAEAFGELAERLNVQLERERAAAAEVRASHAVMPFVQFVLACRHAVTGIIRAALRRGDAIPSARAQP